MKKYLVFAFVLIVSFSVTVTADPTNYISRLKEPLDYIFEEYVKADAAIYDLRISPIIRAEHSEEVPFETSMLMAQNSISHTLTRLAAFKAKNCRIITQSLNISLSAEQTAEGSALLAVTKSNKMMLFLSEKEAAQSNVPDNSLLSDFFDQLLKLTTFNALVDKKGNAIDTNLHKVWLTNLHIDSDRRVQITGYAFTSNDLTSFAAALESDTNMSQVFIHSASSNAYNKFPIWRFDLTGKIIKR